MKRTSIGPPSGVYRGIIDEHPKWTEMPISRKVHTAILFPNYCFYNFTFHCGMRYSIRCAHPTNGVTTRGNRNKKSRFRIYDSRFLPTHQLRLMKLTHKRQYPPRVSKWQRRQERVSRPPLLPRAAIVQLSRVLRTTSVIAVYREIDL